MNIGMFGWLFYTLFVALAAFYAGFCFCRGTIQVHSFKEHTVTKSWCRTDYVSTEQLVVWSGGKLCYLSVDLQRRSADELRKLLDTITKGIEVATGQPFWKPAFTIAKRLCSSTEAE